MSEWTNKWPERPCVGWCVTKDDPIPVLFLAYPGPSRMEILRSDCRRILPTADTQDGMLFSILPTPIPEVPSAPPALHAVFSRTQFDAKAQWYYRSPWSNQWYGQTGPSVAGSSLILAPNIGNTRAAIQRVKDDGGVIFAATTENSRV